jgi:tellurite methyltransferase
MTNLSKWDAIYSKKSLVPKACLVLEQNKHLLPKKGAALDLACGQGGNALLLAEQGLTVSAWDSSSVAIEQLNSLAAERSLTINALVRDVVLNPPEPASLDVLVVSHFLDRDLCSILMNALKPNGLIFYQTFCQNKLSAEGPNNPDFLLKDNELLHLFSSLSARVYREESVLGDHSLGWRNQAMLVAERLFSASAS